MRNFFSIIVIFGVLLVGGGFVYLRHQGEQTRQKIAEDLSSVRRSFAHRARTAANEDDNEVYLRSIKAALSAYDDELKRTVYDKHPDARDLDAYKAKVEERFEEGQLDEARRKSMLEGYDIVYNAYKTLMAGDWNPVITAKGTGDTRIDVYTLKRTVDADGRPLLEGKFLFWGIEDSTQVSWGDLSIRLWKKEMEEVKEGRKKVMKEVDKVLGSAEGEAQPHIIIQKPHHYIADFPSFVSVGSLWLPVLPAEALAADIEYSYRTRAGGSGGEVESKLRWERLTLERSWKLGEGQMWDADEVEATEDEIAGREPEQEEQAAAP